jgi:hypothetical protein
MTISDDEFKIIILNFVGKYEKKHEIRIKINNRRTC